MTSSHSYQLDKSKRRHLLTNQVQSTQFATLAHNEAEVANIFDKWDANIGESEDEDGTCEEDEESELEEEEDEEESDVEHKNEDCPDELLSPHELHRSKSFEVIDTTIFAGAEDHIKLWGHLNGSDEE